MRDEIVSSYLEFREKNKKDFIKPGKNDSKKYLFQMLIVIGAWILALFLVQKQILSQWGNMIVLGLLSFIEIIIMNDWQKDEIKSSKSNIVNLYVYYGRVKDWLGEIHYTNREQVERLCSRYKKKIKETKKQKQNMIKSTDKLINFFIIPIYVACISAVLNSNIDLTEKVQDIITDIIFVMALYFIIVIAVKVTAHYIYDSLHPMKLLVEDLDGVLEVVFLSEKRE